METSATELMKKLKYIEEEINDIHINDDSKSYVPARINAENKYDTMLDSYYDFEGNRARIKELHEEELSIKRVLNEFNHKTKVSGYSFNIDEGLLRLAQLKGEVRVLTNMTKKGRYVNMLYSREGVSMATYDLDKAKQVLRETQKELSALQVALDRTNLNSVIEYQD